MFNLNRRELLRTGCLLAGASLASPLLAFASTDEQQAYQAARKIYLYGWPLLMSEATSRIGTNVPAPTPKGYAPFNQLGRMVSTVKAGFRDVVTVNTEVLFGSAFLDLRKEPMILSVPDMGARYWIAQMQDWWSENLDSAGSRLTGNQAQSIAIVGPGWQGSLPAGMIVRRSATNNLWLLPRLRVNPQSQADVQQAREKLEQFRLVPLSAYGKPDWTPVVDVPPRPPFAMAAPVVQLLSLQGERFYQELAQAMLANSPHAGDAAMLEAMAAIGMTPGQAYDPAIQSQAVRQALALAVRDGTADLKKSANAGWSPKRVNGWALPAMQGDAVPGRFGTDYDLRAVIAYAAFAVNQPEDAIYPNLRVDAHGAPLTGNRRYVLRFSAEQIPQVKAPGFWSLTLYDGEQFLVANPLDRYALAGDSPLQLQPDGSLELYVQADDPGPERRSNWLPAPTQGAFNLTLRVYMPTDAMLAGHWSPPLASPV